MWLTILGWCALGLVGLMVLTWLISLPLRDASIVDIVWGLTFVTVAWIAVAARPDDLASSGSSTSSGRSLALAVMVTVWGSRLAIHLAVRNLGHGEDPRYVSMRRRIGPRFWLVSLVSVFLLQGVLSLVVSLPVTLAAASSAPFRWGVAEALGLVLFGVGLFFETVGDLQLARFKSDPSNAGKVMDRGLWRYTRHPNYFGDCCVWWGIFVVAVGGGGAIWWGVFGPIAMTVLLLRVSGVALLERSIGKRRPEYADYIARTSSFIPRPPRPVR